MEQIDQAHLPVVLLHGCGACMLVRCDDKGTHVLILQLVTTVLSQERLRLRYAKDVLLRACRHLRRPTHSERAQLDTAHSLRNERLSLCTLYSEVMLAVRVRNLNEARDGRIPMR